MRSQPLSSWARASLAVYSRSSGPPVRGVTSLAGLVPAMPRNSTGMTFFLPYGGCEQLEQVSRNGVVLPEAGTVEMRPGEPGRTGRARHGRPEQEQRLVRGSVGADGARPRVGFQLPTTEAGPVGREQFVGRQRAGVEQTAQQRIGGGEYIRSWQPRL